jgi:hydroxypyruvate isomerase
MIRFAANLSMLFGDLPLLERPAAAADLGFREVELWWPFSALVPAEHEIDALATAISRAGVSVALMNLYHSGEHELGLLSIPWERERFRANLDALARMTEKLPVARLNALYGNRQPGLDEEEQAEVAIENLRVASSVAESHGVRIVVEPLNNIDNPHYALTTTAQAIELLRRIGPGSGLPVGVQCDIYHMMRMGEDLPNTLLRLGSAIGHVQLADFPGRGEPGTGTLRWPTILAALEEVGYDGVVGLEYKPTTDVASSLAWLRAYSGEAARFHR